MQEGGGVSSHGSFHGLFASFVVFLAVPGATLLIITLPITGTVGV